MISGYLQLTLQRLNAFFVLYDGVLHVTTPIAAQLRIADRSDTGGFPKPPCYVLEVNELPSQMQRMTIFIDACKADQKSGTAKVIFLTQIANEFGLTAALRFVLTCAAAAASSTTGNDITRTDCE